MLAVLTTLMEKGADMASKSVTFYIDNNNAMLAILKKKRKTHFHTSHDRARLE